MAIDLLFTDELDREEPVDILFLARDATLAEVYRMKLELDGYHVALVAGLDDALGALSVRSADIIYLDLGDMDAAAVMTWQTLRGAPATRHTPMILLSSLDAEQLLKRQVSLGRLDYLITARTIGLPLGQAVAARTI